MKCAGDCNKNLFPSKDGWRKMCEVCFKNGLSGHYVESKFNGPNALVEVRGLAYPFVSDWAKNKVAQDPSILK